MLLEIATQQQFDESTTRLNEILSGREIDELNEREFRLLLKAKVLFVRQGVSINAAVYRARRPNDGQDLSRIRTFSYPGPKNCSRRGRCNLAHKPVFYGASDPDTAIKEEIRTTGGEYDGSFAYLSKWQPCLPMNYLDFIYTQASLKSEIANELADHSRSRLKENLGMYHGSSVKVLPLLAEKIGRSFLSDTHLHSSRICHSILYSQCKQLRQSLPVHGVMYPSFVKDHNGFNFAIAPFAIRDHFIPVAVWRVRISKNEDAGVNLSYTHFGLPDRIGNVSWYEVSPSMHFRGVQGVGVMGSDHILIKVGLDSSIEVDEEQTTIGDFLFSRHWQAIQQTAGALGTLTEDLVPGIQIVRPRHIHLEKALPVQTSAGQVMAKSIMVLVSIQINFEPVSVEALVDT